MFRILSTDKIGQNTTENLARLGVVRAPEIECGPPGNGTKPIFIFISGIESYRSVKVAHIFGRTKKKKSFHSIRIDSIAARLSAVSLNQFEKSIKYFQVCASASFHRSTGGWPKVPAGTFAHLIPSCGRSDLTDKEKRSQNGKPSGKKPPTEKKKPKTKRQFIYSNLFSFRWKILHNDSANNSRGCKFVCAVDLSPWPYFLCVSRNMCVCRIDFSTTTTKEL